MSEPSKPVSSAKPASRASKIGSRIVVGVLVASVALTIVQALGPESWRASNPAVGPEGEALAPPPSDAATPSPDATPSADADTTRLQKGAESPDGGSEKDAADSEKEKDGSLSHAGGGQH